MTSSNGNRYDAIIVGAGHNGLVCSALLAKAGKRVLVLEANRQVGGAAITREFAEGHSVSACAHLLYQLQPDVRKDLKLSTRLASEDMTTVVLSEDGKHVRLHRNRVDGVSASDAEEYSDFFRRMTGFADFLKKHFNRIPPRLGTRSPKDLLALGRLGLDLRLLGKEEMREFLRLIGMNIHDEVTERFKNPLLKGAICIDAVLGTHLGPRSPNTMLTYLHRLTGNHGRAAVPAGGMGSISNELAQVARNAGVTIRTDTPVKRIVINNGRAAGVETISGDYFESWTIISNADPKTTVMKLIGAKHMETGFVRRATHLRARGNAAKLHLALDGLPAVEGLFSRSFSERLLIAPDEHYVERAFNPAKYGESSPQPVLEITFPSCRDETLAPTGQHVLSAVVQYAPYALKGGWNESARTDFMTAVLATLTRYMPDIEQRITASELLTPADIEREFHMSGGHWHHAELSLDQFMFVRPVSGTAHHRLPIDGVYLCGAGAHPGGGVSGAAGRNAARAILAREKSV